MKKKVITSAILTIALAFSLLLGATYALFTSESSNSIDITSGKVSVEAVVDEDSIQTKQLGEEYVGGLEHTFAGGVEFVENQVLLEKLVPGDGVKFTVDILNESNVPVKYRVLISSVAPDGVTVEESLLLLSGLNFEVDGSDFSGVVSYKSAWNNLAVGSDPRNISFTIELPETAGNEYQDLSTGIVLAVEAVQGNAPVTAGEEIIRLDGSANLTDNGISLDIPEGIFAPDQVPTLKITKLAAPTNFVVEQDDTNLVQTLDIKLPGIAEDNEKLITVTIPVDKHMPDAVVYYNDGTQLLPMATTPLTVDGKYFIQFTTTHFSEYVLVERAYDALITNNDGKHTFAYGNLDNIMSAARNGSTIKLNKDAQVTTSILVGKDITLDLNGYDIIAQEPTSTSNNQIFQVTRYVPTEFVITNSQAQGGNIILNNRKLLLAYKPVSFENVTIKQFNENSSTTVINGSQIEVVLSYNILEMKNVKVDITKFAALAPLINSRGAVEITDSQIDIGEHQSNVFNMTVESPEQYFAGQKNRLEINGLVLNIQSMKGQYIIYRHVRTDILINDIEVNATSTASLSLLYRSDGSADGTTVINIKGGVFNGVTKMQNFTDSNPSVLQVTGGTFDFDPTNFVNTELFVVVFDTEVQKWTVQEKLNS